MVPRCAVGGRRALPLAAKAMAEQGRTATAPRIDPCIGMLPLRHARRNHEAVRQGNNPHQPSVTNVMTQYN